VQGPEEERLKGWTPSKSLDIDSRLGKSRKMITLLSSWRDLKGARILDIGAGGGVQAAELAKAAGPEGRVVGVDVEDLRVVHEGFEFHLMSGPNLPVPDRSFDIVISNLVIEHVGNLDDQLKHLQEIERVLDDGGSLYIAMPNRWAPVEPHFGVPFLTWIPARWRTPYLKATKKAPVYDCSPLSYRQATKLFGRAGLRYREETFQVMDIMSRVENPWLGTRILLRAPRWLKRLLHPIIPTLIFRAEPAKR
jgi:ubiquinone/menaquinone biosynthesis C-methylase UbiE